MEINLGSISRRYLISNGFDGTLTAIGIAVGSYLTGVENSLTVFKIGLGAVIGLATSGVWSVWEIEKAEKLAELHQLEDAMLENLSDTEIHREKKKARARNALMSGLGPIIGVLITLAPFLLPINLLEATALSLVTGVVLLFGFGAYMGRISERNWYIAGARMGLAGIVVGIINYLIPG